jgi:hypothetical protein
VQKIGIAGNAFFYFFQNVQADFGFLSGFNLKAPWKSRWRLPGFNTGTFYEVFHFLGLGIGVMLGFLIIFHTGQYTQFAFYGNVVLWAYSTTLRVRQRFLRKKGVKRQS